MRSAKWRARFMVVILSQSLATSDRTLFQLDAAFFRDFEPARDFGTVEHIVLLGRVADGIDAVFDEELLAGGQAHRLPASQKIFIENGVDAISNTPEENDAFNRSEIARWLKVAKEGGIKPE